MVSQKKIIEKQTEEKNEYEKPVLVEIELLDETAKGWSEEPCPP